MVVLIGGALANLAAALLMGAPGRIIVGASGGISALVGAYLVLFPNARLGVVVPGAVFLGTSVQGYARQAVPGAAAVVAVASEGLTPEARLSGTVFESYPQRENFELARAWWRHAGWAEADLYAAAQSFRLGRHRLAWVQQIAGVNYWNDSKATNFHAVEAALRRFDTPVVLIAGGKAKGGDLGGFVRRIAARVQHVVSTT